MKLELFQENKYLFKALSSQLFKMREEFRKELKDSLKIKFAIDLETINKEMKKQIEVNTRAEWPVTPNIDINTYREMGKNSISKEERDEIFFNLYKNKSYNLIEKEWNQIIDYAFDGWKELLVEAKKLHFEGKFKVIVPLLFSYLEAFLARYTDENPEESSKQLVKKFTYKYMDLHKLKFDYYLLESNQQLLERIIFKRGNFGIEEPVFNRNCVLHGRQDPKDWKEIHVIKLIAILSSLTFVKGISKDI